MSTVKVVYVTQFGAWWKLTPAQWRAVCEAGASGEGYELPQSAMLSRRPATVAVDGTGAGASYFCWSPQHVVYKPLDWEPEEFAEHLPPNA